jgi:hypothetical protein
MVNGGVYRVSFVLQWKQELIAVFDRSLFDEIKVAMDDKLTRAAEDPLIKQDENLQLEQDVIVPLAASRKVYVFETTDFWRQMKTAAYVPSLFTLSWAYNIAPRSQPPPSTYLDTTAQPHLYSVNQTPQ